MHRRTAAIAISSGLALVLAACSGSGDSPSHPRAPAAAGSSAASSGSVRFGDNPVELTPPRSAQELSADMLDKALSSDARHADAKKLDDLRHPRQTLAFFGLEPDMSVIEVNPDDGWYAEILAPLLQRGGTYTAAIFSSLSVAHGARVKEQLRHLFHTHVDRYGRARLATFDAQTPNLGTSGSADMVLSFRDVHSWVAHDRANTMFRAVYDVLVPGGVFGVVDNRAPADADSDKLEGRPYVKQKTLVALAKDAGFKLDASSDIQARGSDDDLSTDVPDDADRMTLRFIKPDEPAESSSR